MPEYRVEVPEGSELVMATALNWDTGWVPSIHVGALQWTSSKTLDEVNREMIRVFKRALRVEVVTRKTGDFS